MKVNIPSPLRSYTGNKSQVEATGSNLSALLSDLEAQYPGIKFRMIDEQNRIRQHIKLFVNREQAFDLDALVNSSDVIHIICALSGG
jgi:molybdopterin converting factor small subunit